MKERVNIQYSIEIDKLGEEISRLTTCALTDLNHLASKSKNISTADTLSYQFYDSIDSLRQSLASVDISLAEINHLVSSYLSYKSDVVTQDQQAAATEQMPSPEVLSQQAEDVSNINDLQNKIERFKQALQEGEFVTNDNADQR